MRSGSSCCHGEHVHVAHKANRQLLTANTSMDQSTENEQAGPAGGGATSSGNGMLASTVDDNDSTALTYAAAKKQLESFGGLNIEKQKIFIERVIFYFKSVLKDLAKKIEEIKDEEAQLKEIKDKEGKETKLKEIKDKETKLKETKLKAVALLKGLVAKCSASSVEIHFVPLVEELCVDKSDLSRQLACNLLPACYKNVSDPFKDDLLQKFKGLSKDNVPAVREAVACNLGEFNISKKNSAAKTSMVDLYTVFTADKEESVRVSAVEAGIALSTTFLKTDLGTQFETTFFGAFKDDSENVRAKAAQGFWKAQVWLFKQDLEAYQTFLKDDSIKVKCAAAWQLKDVIGKFSKDKRESFVVGVIPSVQSVLKVLGKCEEIKDSETEQTVTLLKALVAECSSSSIETHFVPLAMELCSDKSDLSRQLACYLLPACYKHVFDSFLLQKFKDMGADNAPVIRKAVACNLGEFAKVSKNSAAKTSMVDLYTVFTSDKQESVRVLAVEAGIALSTTFLKTDLGTQFETTFFKAFKDDSENVRAKAAQGFWKAPHWLFERDREAYQTFLKDDSIKVKCAAACPLKDVCDKFPKERKKSFVEGVIDSVKGVAELGKDADTQKDSEDARVKLPDFTTSAAPILGEQDTIEKLLPILEIQLKDQDAASKVISHWDLVTKAVGGWEQLVKNLSADACNFAEKFPQTDAIKFAEEFKPLFKEWLFSRDDTKGNCAVSNFKMLAKNYGQSISISEASVDFSSIEKIIVEMASGQCYLIKMRALFLVNELVDVTSRDVRIKYLFSAVERMAKDNDSTVCYELCKTVCCELCKTVCCELCKTIRRLCCQKDYLNPEKSGDASAVWDCLHLLKKKPDDRVKQAAKKEIVKLFGTFKSKTFALGEKDETCDQPDQPTLLWLRLRHCLDVVTSLLYSLTEVTMDSLLKKFVASNNTKEKPTWEELCQFFVDTANVEFLSKEKIDGNMQRFLKNSGEIGNKIDSKPEAFIKAVIKDDAYLILYMYVNDFRDDRRQVATNVMAADHKACFEFLKNHKSNWQLDEDDRKKWDILMKNLIIFRNARSHNQVVELVDAGGSSVEEEVDRTFSEFVELAGKIVEKVSEDTEAASEEPIKTQILDVKKRVKDARAALEVPLVYAWVKANSSALRLIMKGPSKKHVASVLVRQLVLIAKLWPNGNAASETAVKLGKELKQCVERMNTPKGRLLLNPSDVQVIFRVFDELEKDETLQKQVFGNTISLREDYEVAGESADLLTQTDVGEGMLRFEYADSSRPIESGQVEEDTDVPESDEPREAFQESSSPGTGVPPARPPVTTNGSASAGGATSGLGEDASGSQPDGESAMSAVQGNDQNYKQLADDVNKLISNGNLQRAQQLLAEAITKEKSTEEQAVS